MRLLNQITYLVTLCLALDHDQLSRKAVGEGRALWRVDKPGNSNDKALQEIEAAMSRVAVGAGADLAVQGPAQEASLAEDVSGAAGAAALFAPATVGASPASASHSAHCQPVQLYNGPKKMEAVPSKSNLQPGRDRLIANVRTWPRAGAEADGDGPAWAGQEDFGVYIRRADDGQGGSCGWTKLPEGKKPGVPYVQVTPVQPMDVRAWENAELEEGSKEHDWRHYALGLMNDAGQYLPPELDAKYSKVREDLHWYDDHFAYEQRREAAISREDAAEFEAELAARTQKVEEVRYGGVFELRIYGLGSALTYQVAIADREGEASLHDVQHECSRGFPATTVLDEQRRDCIPQRRDGKFVFMPQLTDDPSADSQPESVMAASYRYKNDGHEISATGRVTDDGQQGCDLLRVVTCEAAMNSNHKKDKPYFRQLRYYLFHETCKDPKNGVQERYQAWIQPCPLRLEDADAATDSAQLSSGCGHGDACCCQDGGKETTPGVTSAGTRMNENQIGEGPQRWNGRCACVPFGGGRIGAMFTSASDRCAAVWRGGGRAWGRVPAGDRVLQDTLADPLKSYPKGSSGPCVH